MYPDAFEIPTEAEKRAIEPGAVVKLMFQMKDGWGERMWVSVSGVGKRHLTGVLINQPVGIPRLTDGATIKFTHSHVIDIDWPAWVQLPRSRS